MGREQLFRQIRKQGTTFMVLGIVLAVICAFLAFCLFVVYSDEKDTAALVVALIFLGLGALCGLMIKSGVANRMHPEKNKAFKKNPDLLYMVDELFKGVKYQDKFVIISDRVIANASNLFQIAFLNEVFMVYVFKQTTNLVTTIKQLVLATARDEITISIMGLKDEAINQLANNVASVCQYAVFGYSPQNLDYLNKMRRVWEQKKNEQKMGISPQQVQQQQMQRQQAIQNGQQQAYDPDNTVNNSAEQPQNQYQNYNGQGNNGYMNYNQDPYQYQNNNQNM